MKPKKHTQLFVTTQNGRVANSWKSSYFNQHPLQTTCNMSKDVQYELGMNKHLLYEQRCEVHASRLSSLVQWNTTKNAFHGINHKSYLYTKYCKKG